MGAAAMVAMVALERHPYFAVIGRERTMALFSEMMDEAGELRSEIERLTNMLKASESLKNGYIAETERLRTALSMSPDDLANMIYAALVAQPGDNLDRTSNGFGFKQADDGKTILDGAYDLDAVAVAVLQHLNQQYGGEK